MNENCLNMITLQCWIKKGNHMTEKGKKLLEENKNLVYWYLHKRGIYDEDIAGDVMVKLCESIDSYDESCGAISTFIINVAKNAVANIYRDRNYQKYKINNEYKASLTDKVIGDNSLSWAEILPDYNGSMSYDIFISDCREQFNDFQNDIFNLLLKGRNQSEIAGELGYTQQYIGVKIKQMKKIINDNIIVF